MINLYVIWRLNRWHVVVTGARTPIASGLDRAAMVELACELAGRSDGDVSVYGKASEVEAVYTYRDARIKGLQADELRASL